MKMKVRGNMLDAQINELVLIDVSNLFKNRRVS